MECERLQDVLRYCGCSRVVKWRGNRANGVATKVILNRRVEGVERGVGSDSTDRCQMISESILSPDDIREIVDNIMEPILWWRTW